MQQTSSPLYGRKFMPVRIIQLLQLFFAIFSVYCALKFTGNQQKLVPLFCLVLMYGLDKLQTAVEASLDAKKATGSDWDQGKADSTGEYLRCLLKSSNVLLLGDAIQRLLHDLGLLVSKMPDSQTFVREVKIEGESLSLGIYILQDITELALGDGGHWQKIINYDVEQGDTFRPLVLWTNCSDPDAAKLTFGLFPANVQKELKARKVVALTSYTLFKIYSLCKKQSLDIKQVIHKIHRHPGGVFQLEDYQKK